MIFKEKRINKTNLSIFDLLDKKEVNLCKAFAYLLSSDGYVFTECLKSLFEIRNAKLSDYEIKTEQKDTDGRTDLEIVSDKNHIIFECKIQKNFVKKKQSKQYTSRFAKENKKNFFCYLTENMPCTYIPQISGITFSNKNWSDIIYMLENLKLEQKSNLVYDFINYYKEVYKLNNKKEILIQDVGSKSKELFLNYYIYYRESVKGYPSYFAPYFIENEGIKEGIKYIAPIMYVQTENRENLQNISDRLQLLKSEDNDNFGDKWREGLEIISKDIDKDSKKNYTFFFLGKPKELNIPILKNVIPLQKRIPPNYTISFIDFIDFINVSSGK